MCDVCKSEGLNTRLINGQRNHMAAVKLYRVFENGVARLTLCYFHSIELFVRGETIFMAKHLKTAKTIASDKVRYLGL